MALREDQEHHRVDDPKDDVQHSRNEFQPRNDPKAVSADQGENDNVRVHHQNDVPVLRDIVGITYGDNHRGLICYNVDDACQDRDPAEPGDPALHPGDESAPFWGRIVPRPVVLRARDGLFGGQLGERGNLAQHAGDDDKEPPDNCSRTAVEEHQADVSILS